MCWSDSHTCGQHAERCTKHIHRATKIICYKCIVYWQLKHANLLTLCNSRLDTAYQEMSHSEWGQIFSDCSLQKNEDELLKLLFELKNPKENIQK